MPADRYRILCTRPLPGTLLETAADNRIDITVIPFIRVEPVIIPALQAQLDSCFQQPVIFTSAHAVNILASHYLPGHHITAPQICCLSGGTLDAVKNTFPDALILATAPDGTALANAILRLPAFSNATFFCGNRRREEIPTLLQEHQIQLTEWPIYKNIAAPVSTPEIWDGVLFFSPSAVESYFSVNTLPPQAVCFAIGNTTARALKEVTGNEVVTGHSPAAEELVTTAIHYFNNRQH